MTHTPGPWTYEGAMNSKEIRVGPQRYFVWADASDPRVPMQSGQEVATLTMPKAASEDICQETLANARLIAAAPALLQAAEEALTGAISHVGATKLRAAIALAKGENK